MAESSSGNSLWLNRMKTRQIKRPRPNLETARKFFNEGWSVDPQRHYTSREERETQIQFIYDSLKDIGKRFPRTQNVEYAVLKAHLILEYAIIQYIRGYSEVYLEEKDINFSFYQKMEIAYFLGFGANDPRMLPTIQGINKIRNQIAHSFAFDKKDLDEILRINSDDYDGFIVSKDTERIKYLRLICQFICGRVAGEMLGAYAVAVHFEERQEGAEN